MKEVAQQRVVYRLLFIIWYKSLELHNETQLTALYMAKTFDKVWHSALLNKLLLPKDSHLNYTHESWDVDL